MKYHCRSKSDPNPKGLVFDTQEAADSHRRIMNISRIRYPEGWNTDYWKAQPDEWVVEELT
jgi:hypothetical protein